jgi:hypothetical protein
MTSEELLNIARHIASLRHNLTPAARPLEIVAHLDHLQRVEAVLTSLSADVAATEARPIPARYRVPAFSVVQGGRA